MFTKRELLVIIRGLGRGIEDCDSILEAYSGCDKDPLWKKFIKDTKKEREDINKVREKVVGLWEKVGEK